MVTAITNTDSFECFFCSGPFCRTFCLDAAMFPGSPKPSTVAPLGGEAATSAAISTDAAASSLVTTADQRPVSNLNELNPSALLLDPHPEHHPEPFQSLRRVESLVDGKGRPDWVYGYGQAEALAEEVFDNELPQAFAGATHCPGLVEDQQQQQVSGSSGGNDGSSIVGSPVFKPSTPLAIAASTLSLPPSMPSIDQLQQLPGPLLSFQPMKQSQIMMMLPHPSSPHPQDPQQLHVQYLQKLQQELNAQHNGQLLLCSQASLTDRQESSCDNNSNSNKDIEMDHPLTLVTTTPTPAPTSCTVATTDVATNNSTEAGPTRFHCPRPGCRQHYPTRKGLSQHIKRIHSDKAKTTCLYCQVTLHQNELGRHCKSKRHIEAEATALATTGISAMTIAAKSGCSRTENRPSQQAETSTTTPSFVELTSSRSSSSSSSLSPPSPSSPVSTAASLVPEYYCVVCKKSKSRSDALWIHMKNRHNQDSRVPKTKQDRALYLDKYCVHVTNTTMHRRLAEQSSLQSCL